MGQPLGNGIALFPVKENCPIAEHDWRFLNNITISVQ